MTKTSMRLDFIGGVTTFLTMAYIIAVNPAILATEGTGMSFAGVLTATVLLASSMTIMMGLYARLPFAVAPGMGLNAFFTFTLVLGQKIPWQQALGITVWAGVIFLVVSLTPAREKIAEAVPAHLKSAAACGIGFFLTFIGLKNMGFVVANPATFVGPGHMSGTVILGLMGLALGAFLLARKSVVALLLPIALVTLAALLLGYVKWPEQLVMAPDFSSTFLQADIWGALKVAYIPALLAIVFTDLFDSISTFVGVSEATGMLDANGKPQRLKQGLVVDAFATFTAGLFGTSSGTAYIESAAGIEAGGRSGRASVVTGLCFLPFLFLSPLIAIVPPYATAPILVLVGMLMFRSASRLKFDAIEDVLPCFLTVILIPLTFSITQGMMWGFISHVLLYSLRGRRKEIDVTMNVLAVISVAILLIENGF